MSELRPAQEITPQRLFEVLQQEYLICILRAKIYPLQKLKDYWQNLADKKKEKIFYTKQKYGLLSIFDDERILKEFENKTYNQFGFPNFYYPNEKVKEQQIYWDIRNYYCLGSIVEFMDSEDNYKIKKGVIKKLDVEEKLVTIESESAENIVEWDNVKRIL